MAKAELLYVGSEQGLSVLSNPGGMGRWLKGSTAFGQAPVVAVWAHPQDPTQILCSTPTQLWASRDGGQQWAVVDAPAMQQLIASRSAPDRIVACDQQHVYISDDAGQHWQQGPVAHTVMGAADAYWALTHDATQTSTDGQTWSQSTTQAHSVAMSADGKAHFVYTSTAHWHDLTVPPPAGALRHAACLSGDPAVLVAQYETGLYRYDSIWQPLADAPVTTCLHAVSYHPDRLWAGTATGELWYSTDRGLTWELVRAIPGAVMALASARLL